ncbi:MAG: hypothetical protein HKP55_12445 [Gammaproteobacteria bacterium]|nr:hypothetical protein [Gammaproteobacteria bacterium]
MLDIEIEKQHKTANEESHGKFVILCKQCQFHLSSSDYAIAVEGHHEHVQCNPQGCTFFFRCFSRVPGAILSGDPTQEYSWFTGYSWQFSHCQGCGEHLGWFFQNQQNDTFFGLISEKIIVAEKKNS